MGTFIFHNKYHKNAHHTVPMSGFPDSASDPIASEDYPFLGVFHNTISNNISGNSLDWSNTFTTTSANSAIWDRYLSVFTTVSSNSAFWENNRSFYTSYNAISSNLDSAFTTVSLNSSFWDRLYSDDVLHTDRVQQDTRQKNFAIFEISPSDISNMVLDLSGGQVSYYVISNTSNISGFSGAKKGGKYYLYVVTNGTCNSAIKLNFHPNNFKFSSSNSYPITGSWLRKFEFISDGNYLHGESIIFDTNTLEERDTYFQGVGITLNSNPSFYNDGDSITPEGGILINGIYPYTASDGIIMTNNNTSLNFSFAFTSSNAQSAMGTSDRITLSNPNLTVINNLTANRVVPFLRCDFHDSIDVFTRPYGYISQLIFDNEEIKDFVFRTEGYTNHETGHQIKSGVFPITGDHSLFVNFRNSVPLELSGGISLWLDAMDYSTVGFLASNNFITGLSSKISNVVSFSSVSASQIFYNTSPKQSINYNLSSTHYSGLIISGNGDFATLTVLTPVASSQKIEWLWNNGEYGIFKIPNTFSIGIGNLSSFYTYTYGSNNTNKPISVGTLYLSASHTQSTWINGPLSNTGLALTANFTGGYTMIGGLNPLTGYSNFKLHENILYKGAKSIIQMNSLNAYLVDKWKFI
jgi:hypothetical protein